MRLRLLGIILAFTAAFVFCQSGPAPAADKSVGVILSGDLPCYKEGHKAFVEELARAGYDKGKVDVYLQAPNPDQMSWVNSVRKFSGIGVDVIVTFGAPSTLAALKEGGGIPVVYTYVYGPEESGVKKPGSTGVSSKLPMVTLLKTLKSVAPVTKLGVVFNPEERDSVVQLEDIRKNSAALGMHVVEIKVRDSSELRNRVSGALGDIDSLFVSCSAAVGKEAQWVIDFAQKKKLPLISQLAGIAEKGALIALAPSPSEQGELAARKVAAILGGKKPDAMPVEGAKQVDLVLNLKTATALGLKVPFDVLNAATKVIK